MVRGPYRFVRNPMYIGAGMTLAGAALYCESVSIFIYAALFFLITHLFVVLYEEPTLRRTFGDEYEAYCSRVTDGGRRQKNEGRRMNYEGMGRTGVGEWLSLRRSNGNRGRFSKWQSAASCVVAASAVGLRWRITKSKLLAPRMDFVVAISSKINCPGW